MAATSISSDTRTRRRRGTPAWADVRATACDMTQRAIAWAAAAILICAVAAALVQLVAELLSFPAPIAVTGMTLMAAALFLSLCRHLRRLARRRSGQGNQHRLQR
jgi:hypothetical protein